jgi:hypothetical protein
MVLPLLSTKENDRGGKTGGTQEPRVGGKRCEHRQMIKRYSMQW